MTSRRLSAILAGLVVAMIALSESPGGTLAQSASPPPEVALMRFDGTLGPRVSGCVDDEQRRREPVTAAPGRRVYCVEASDPHMSGRLVMDVNGDGTMWVASVILETRSGGWTGSVSALGDIDSGPSTGWMALQGTGGYAGLGAMLTIDDGRMDGMIGTNGLPEFPRPVDLSSDRP